MTDGRKLRGSSELLPSVEEIPGYVIPRSAKPDVGISCEMFRVRWGFPKIPDYSARLPRPLTGSRNDKLDFFDSLKNPCFHSLKAWVFLQNGRKIKFCRALHSNVRRRAFHCEIYRFSSERCFHHPIIPSSGAGFPVVLLPQPQGLLQIAAVQAAEILRFPVKTPGFSVAHGGAGMA